MKKEKYKQILTGRVYRETWAPGDTYLAVDIGKVQVFQENGFRVGDSVVITIERKEK